MTLRSAAAVLVIILLPCFFYMDRAKVFFGAVNETDAVSSASLVVPEQPSGEFVVLLNKELHPDTLSDWDDFFNEEPVGVIFEDLKCLVVTGDMTGIQTAERYRARLAENQMKISAENPLFAASRVQWGAFDVMICSAEAAESIRLDTVYKESFIYKMTVSDTAVGAS